MRMPFTFFVGTATAAVVLAFGERARCARLARGELC